MVSHLRLLVLAATVALGLAAAPAAMARPAVDLWVVGGGDDWVGAVDARTIQRTGDIATLDFLLLNREPDNGSDYTLTRHQLNCKERTYQTVRMGHYSQEGGLVGVGMASRAALTAPANSVAAHELDFVCDGDRNHEHWEGVTIAQVLRGLRLDWADGQPDKVVNTDWWVIAGAKDIYFVADAASVRRQGDKAWVKVIAARRTAGGDGYDYLVGEDMYDCATGQTQAVAAAGYRSDGTFLGDFPLDNTELQAVPGDALNQTEYAFACKGRREPAFRLGAYPAVSIVKGIRDNWSSM